MIPLPCGFEANRSYNNSIAEFPTEEEEIDLLFEFVIKNFQNSSNTYELSLFQPNTEVVEIRNGQNNLQNKILKLKNKINDLQTERLILENKINDLETKILEQKNEDQFESEKFQAKVTKTFNHIASLVQMVALNLFNIIYNTLKTLFVRIKDIVTLNFSFDLEKISEYI